MITYQNKEIMIKKLWKKFKQLVKQELDIPIRYIF